LKPGTVVEFREESEKILIVPGDFDPVDGLFGDLARRIFLTKALFEDKAAEMERTGQWVRLCKRRLPGESVMHVITRKRLNDFAEKYPEAQSALIRWYRLMKSANFAYFAELREIFPDAYQVGKLTVFNIGGNKVRLISAIHYNRRKVYIRAVLTHEEYGKSKWKE